MATIFRERWRRPIPDGAQVIERRGKKVAGWTDSQGRRQSAELDKDGERIVSYYPHWFARYRDADGVMRRVSTGCTDSQAAKQFLAKIVAETEKVKVGIISREEASVGGHSDAPLEKHVEAYTTHMRACERNSDHIQNTRQAILRVAKDCDFGRLRDVQRIKAERWLLKHAELGMSARTRNTYRIALVAFGNWCVRESRLLANPFAALPRANEAADRRRERRALTTEEIGKLLKAAEERPLHNLMMVTRGKKKGQLLANLSERTRDRMRRVGQSNAMFYRIAIFTGLRYSEIKSLKIADVHLDADLPYLDLHAMYDKARRGARQPLSDDLVEHLRQYIAGRLLQIQEEARCQNAPCPIALSPDERLIPHVPLLRAFNMDLEYAGIEKKDDRGRTVDIHSLRHTFVAQIPANQMPVLGLFRPDAATLARDLASFLNDVFRGLGRTISVRGTNVQVAAHPQGGEIADAVLLGHTVNEHAARFNANPPRERLPRLLRRELMTLNNIGVFNPRGQALRDIPQVQELLGLVLLCIDPSSPSQREGPQQAAAHLRQDTRNYLCEWRQAAQSFIAMNPIPRTPRTLAGFVQGWQTRSNQTQTGAAWPDEWPILELCYKLITWSPFFQDDPEGQVYLEAVSRCVAQAATFSPYRSTILSGRGVHDSGSVRNAIMNIMAPLAENAVEVDEDIMPHIPRNRLPIMTIHQAKGLEFPLVIVDISSDYTTNHRTQRFRRFPESPTTTQLLEDDTAPYCAIGALRAARPALARSFDDLVRLYYVAYSRPQSLLMLVGVDACLRYNTTIRHVATAWRMNGTWAWQRSVSGRPPAVVNGHPLELI